MSAPTLKPVTPRNRLQPLATVVAWVFWAAAAVTALQVILALTRSGTLLISDPNFQPGALVCLQAAQPLLPHTGSSLSQAALSPGVRASWNAASVCTAHPTAGQGLAFAITLLPIDLLHLGALYLLMRLARTAARDGIYTTTAARQVLILGWWLLAGELVATVAEGFARLNLLGQLVTWHLDWVHWPASWGVSWPVVFIGVGLIIFARVMRISAGMRADLEGTV
jgi:hypothetical protein